MDDNMQLLLRFGGLIQMVVLLAFIAIPVALFLIWNELGKLNEHFRIQRVLDDARAR